MFSKGQRPPVEFFTTGTFQAPAPALVQRCPWIPDTLALCDQGWTSNPQGDQGRVSGTVTETLDRNDGANVTGQGDHHTEGAGAKLPLGQAKRGSEAETNSHAEEARLRGTPGTQPQRKAGMSIPCGHRGTQGTVPKAQGPKMRSVVHHPPALWDQLLRL